MNLNDLQRVNIEEANTLLNNAFNTSIEVYFIETNSGKPTLLSIGDLEKIRKAFPRKVQIYLETPSSGIIRYFDWVGTEDLMIRKTNHQELLGKMSGNKDNLKESERKSLYKIILAMVTKKYGYDPRSTRNPATGTGRGSIQADIESIGLTMDDETIRFYIKDAYEMLEDEISITEKK